MSFRFLSALGLTCSLVLGAFASWAQIRPLTEDPMAGFVRVDPRLRPAVDVELLADAEGLLPFAVSAGWESFLATTGGEWIGYVDRRTGRLEYAEGSGIPWIPGHGNALKNEDLAGFLGKDGEVGLAILEARARRLLESLGEALGVNPDELVLSEERSGAYGGYLWFVEFDLVRAGLRVEGARVVFRVNNGNLIQFGSENLPSPNAVMPKARIAREEARDAVEAWAGSFSAEDEMVDEGTLRLLPVLRSDAGFAEGYAFGNGRELLTVWEFAFRRPGSQGTWQARVDASTGELLEMVDTNAYDRAIGGVYPIAAFFDDETLMPMPYANLGNGAFADSAGRFSSSMPATTTLNGQLVRIVDRCGAVSASQDPNGDISLGLSAGTDCDTPGFGGAGNTHSARMQFYHVNRAKETGRGWLPANTWLGNQLRVTVNDPQACNAFWNGSTLTFFQSGSVGSIQCANTGETAGVSLHEYGHGLDQNDGSGSSLDLGTGETYGDFTAVLQTHDSCVGNGFFQFNCAGYGDPCTDCTGVRDIDWAERQSATPHTVANFIQPTCPTHAFYHGPCGREGHCESYVASEALWDLPMRDLPGAGSATAWAVAERLWYLSRPTATHAFTCDTSGPAWASDGCATGTYWRAMRAVDDDDGDLTNGTPHSAELFAAFDRHGMACASDPGASTSQSGCATPATPTVTLTGGSNQVTVAWSGGAPGGVYDVFRNELGCDAGFAKIADDETGASLVDTGVIDGGTYFYQVVAQPAGNEACASTPSACQQITLRTALDVWSQDRPQDTGLEPDPATNGEPMHESEDIWVRTDANPGPHQNPVPGQQNRIWVKARNRSAVDGYGVPVKIYAADASAGLAWPNGWTHVGTALADVPANGSADVSVPWTPPGAGHYCLLARLDTPQDPMRRPEESNIWRNVRYNNNIVWRNLNIISLRKVVLEKVTLRIRNLRDDGLLHHLVLRDDLKAELGPFIERGRVEVRLPNELYERWKQEGEILEGFEPIDEGVFEVQNPERAFLTFPLKAHEEFEITLIFEDLVGDKGGKKDTEYLFRVLQEEADGEEPVGGVSYKVSAPVF